MTKQTENEHFATATSKFYFLFFEVFVLATIHIGAYINNSRHLARKDARIFVRGHYLFRDEKRTVFRERSSRKTVSYEELIMSKDKYPSMFSPQMEAIVFTILQIFFAMRAIFKIANIRLQPPTVRDHLSSKMRNVFTSNHYI